MTKNVQETDMRMMLKKERKRKAEEGKATIFTVRGRIVPPE